MAKAPTKPVKPVGGKAPKGKGVAIIIGVGKPTDAPVNPKAKGKQPVVNGKNPFADMQAQKTKGKAPFPPKKKK